MHIAVSLAQASQLPLPGQYSLDADGGRRESL